MKQGGYSEELKQAGGKEQQEPHEIQQGQIRSPDSVKEEPLATTQAEDWQAGEQQLCREVLGAPGR